ncbi:MAG: LLM class flavin-dependent oxidoreductase [Streptomycetaceae bacterium]|nr:LLM class flavin-dependent oxidoreductase [Streptomycetaceae bacterium]
MSPDIRLSVLDTAPAWHGATTTEALRNSIDLASRVDDLGYHRYWLAEHHNTPALSTSSPAVLIGRIADATSRMRVGSGGVMLPNHAPLVVAEQFGTLAALQPDRIDLGVGRAPGTDPRTARAIRGAAAARSGADFPEQVGELLGYFPSPKGDPARSPILAVPAMEHAVPVWVLGSSGHSARLAGQLGLPYAYAHHFNPHGTADAVSLYHAAFEPSEYLSEPYAMATVVGFVADTDEHAHWLAGPLKAITVLSMRGHNPLFPTPEAAAELVFSAEEQNVIRALYGPQLIGSPDTVREHLAALVAATGVDEVMVTTAVHDHAQRVRSYELLADVAAPAH